MLVELGVVEQRFRAVLEVLGGAPVTDVARRYGVARQTVHRWLRCYAQSGVQGLVDQSPKPHSCPHQMPAKVEVRVVEMRWAHPDWGPRTIRYHLEQEGVSPVPSRSGIYRALLRHNLVRRKRRRRPRSSYRRWERSRSMELWQMDVMGGVKLVDGSEAKVVTGIDDHSRFCVSALVVKRATARPVCDGLALAMRRHGVPDQILTDNGKVFTGRFGPVGGGEVLFDRVCRENGIDHLLTAPRSPTTTGKVERFHKTVRNEFLQGRVFASVEEAQEELDRWVEHYNTARPHQGIGMVPPIRRFELAICESLEVVIDQTPQLPEPPPPADGARRVTRKVGQGGRISLAGHKYHVGRWLAGETVTVAINGGLVEVWHREVLVVSHARQHAVEDEPAVWQRRPRGRPVRPETTGVPVTRKVDPSGSISFAAASYRAGNKYRGKSVQVRVVGDTVEISRKGRVIRSHPIRHDPAKEHGAFATPQGRPRRRNAAS